MAPLACNSYRKVWRLVEESGGVGWDGSQDRAAAQLPLCLSQTMSSDKEKCHGTGLAHRKTMSKTG